MKIGNEIIGYMPSETSTDISYIADVVVDQLVNEENSLKQSELLGASTCVHKNSSESEKKSVILRDLLLSKGNQGAQLINKQNIIARINNYQCVDIPKSGKLGLFKTALLEQLNKAFLPDEYQKEVTVIGFEHQWSNQKYYGPSGKRFQSTSYYIRAKELIPYNATINSNFEIREFEQLLWRVICHLPGAQQFELTKPSNPKLFLPAVKYGSFVVHKVGLNLFALYTSSRLKNELYNARGLD